MIWLRKRLVSVFLFGLFVGACSGLLFGQPNPQAPCGQTPNACWQAYVENTGLSSSTESLTVQGTSTSGTLLVRRFIGYCSVACDITIKQNGTAATSTALAITPLNLSDASKATAWTQSNASGGSTIWKVSIPAGGEYNFDMSSLLIGPTSANNITATTSAISGTARMKFLWTKQ